MIVEFTVGNFLSFKEKRTISFEAKGISELKQNIISHEKHRLLRSAVIYGANSSGKSNFIRAFGRMRDCILDSVRLNDSDELSYNPFLLSSENENQPTFFEIIFLDQSERYRYGFEYNLHEIINEWLFVGNKSKKEVSLFIRTNEGIGVSNKFEEGYGKETATNDNRLFVSLVAQLGGSVSKKIIELFNDCNVLSGLNHEKYNGYTKKMIHKQLEGYSESLSLYKILKLGFQNVQIAESEFNTSVLPVSLSNEVKLKLLKDLEGKKMVTLKTIHNKYNKNGQIIDLILFDKDNNESEGTNKIMDLSGPIFNTLIHGKVIIIDELDAKLHPLISIYIVNLFNNPKTNPNNAQLLFATHDTNLLSTDFFRRDQIWFTEKDDIEQTDLYSLYDFNLPDGTKVRTDSNLEKNYIRGRYGAIPFITNLNF